MKKTPIVRILIMAIVFGTVMTYWQMRRVSAQQPATAPSPKWLALNKQLKEAEDELRKITSNARDLLDENKRKEMAPRAIPAMKKMISLFEQLAEIDPQAKAVEAQFKQQFLPAMALMGDAESENTLKEKAQSKEPREALTAKGAVMLVGWWRATKDPAAQAKIADEATALAESNPQDDAILPPLVMMARDGAATPELKQRIEKIIIGEMKGPGAVMYQRTKEAERKQKALENKPITIDGVRMDGTKFSTADWKGKVVLVFFWASPDEVSRSLTQQVSKLYSQYHDKGFEVLGVSFDQSGDELKKFLAANKDIVWPQLFDEKNPGHYSLAMDYGIVGVPAMFLIDRRGMLRSSDALESFQEMVGKMVEEK